MDKYQLSSKYNKPILLDEDILRELINKFDQEFIVFLQTIHKNNLFVEDLLMVIGKTITVDLDELDSIKNNNEDYYYLLMVLSSSSAFNVFLQFLPILGHVENDIENNKHIFVFTDSVTKILSEHLQN